MKYGRNGKHIVIAVKPLANNDIQIIIKNDGDPIPKEALEQLFERFYRAEMSRSQASTSTGLGLAIAKSIVELHAGTITADTSPAWTEFIIELPKTAKEKIKLFLSTPKLQGDTFGVFLMLLINFETSAKSRLFQGISVLSS